MARTETYDEMEEVQKRARMSRKEKMEKGMFKLPQGYTTFRILKTPAGKRSPAIYWEYFVHRNVGPRKLTKTCGKDLAEEGTCWLCEKVEELKDKGKQERAKDMERKAVYAVNIAVLDEDTQELRGPLFWPTSSGKSAAAVSWKLGTIITSKKAGVYLDHKTGYNYTIERQGTGMTDTKYSDTERADESMPVPKVILAKLKPFDEIVYRYDAEEQKNAFYGREEEEGEDRPKRKFDRNGDEPEDEPRKPRARVEEEDEDEEAKPKRRAAVEEDEEEDAKPRRKRVEPEDEEDLNFGEDDEEEKKPKRKTDDEDESLEDEPPRRKPVTYDNDEDEDAVKPRKKPVAEEVEEEEPDERPRRKRAEVEEEEEVEEERPKKPAKVAAKPKRREEPEEEEEEATPPRKRR
jgi:hypothetical protein